MSLINLKYRYHESVEFCGMYPDRQHFAPQFFMNSILNQHTALPQEWSPGFVTDNNLRFCVTPFWCTQTYLPDGMQYELFNHLVFNNRESKYIHETAKKYYSKPHTFHFNEFFIRSFDGQWNF